jgi:hypothetical protein
MGSVYACSQAVKIYFVRVGATGESNQAEGRRRQHRWGQRRLSLADAVVAPPPWQGCNHSRRIENHREAALRRFRVAAAFFAEAER